MLTQKTEATDHLDLAARHLPLPPSEASQAGHGCHDGAVEQIAVVRERMKRDLEMQYLRCSSEREVEQSISALRAKG